LDDGESCARIAKFLYLDDDTIRGWDKTYRQVGWDALAFDGRKGGQSRMTQAQEAALALGWRDASAAQPSRSEPISQLNLIWNIHIPAASSFWPDWVLNIASQSPCHASPQRKCRQPSLHCTNA